MCGGGGNDNDMLNRPLHDVRSKNITPSNLMNTGSSASTVWGTHDLTIQEVFKWHICSKTSLEGGGGGLRKKN